jgi:hypothetical protein
MIRERSQLRYDQKIYHTKAINAANLANTTRATIPGKPNPRYNPTTGRRNVKMLDGIVTAFTSQNVGQPQSNL